MSPYRDMNKRTITDGIWRALADSTRRTLLDELAKAPRTTGELVELCPQLCRTAVMKHLDVLEEAGLLFVRREGRVRWNHINAMPIQNVYDRWVSKHVRGIAATAGRLQQHAESAANRTTKKAPRRKTQR